MRELLDNLDILREPDLDPRDLCLAGIPFGSRSTSIPRERVVNVTLSPIVATHRSGPLFFDVAGNPLSLDAVIDSVLDGDGVLHFAEAVSFTISGGVVAGFTLYGESLRHFGELESYSDFCSAFGPADEVVVKEAHDTLLGHEHHYRDGMKRVDWDEINSRVSLISLRARPQRHRPATRSKPTPAKEER